jgi:uncharacterized protein YjbJ (UPF0337 family)
MRGTTDLPDADGHRLSPGQPPIPDGIAGKTKENSMSEEVNGSGAAKDGIEGAAVKAKEFAGEATGNVKEFFSGDVAANAKELAGDITENTKELAGDVTENTKELAGGVTEGVKGLGAKIAGLFKSGK